MRNPVIVCVADVGSISAGNFGWCRAEVGGESKATGSDILEFASCIASDLNDGRQVALGLECPLFVPVAQDPLRLTRARPGEGARPWSVHAGSGALAVGLAESVWILERVRKGSRVAVVPTLDWDQFALTRANLFLWEAFVTKEAKSRDLSHQGDAAIAAETFIRCFPHIAQSNCVTAENPFSLIGAALLRSGLDVDPRMLRQPCIVLKS